MDAGWGASCPGSPGRQPGLSKAASSLGGWRLWEWAGWEALQVYVAAVTKAGQEVVGEEMGMAAGSGPGTGWCSVTHWEGIPGGGDQRGEAGATEPVHGGEEPGGDTASPHR